MSRKQSIVALHVAVMTVALLVCAAAWAQTETVLHSFRYGTGDGYQPASPLVEHAGSLYGATPWGGINESLYCFCGTIFQLSPNQDGTWTESVLHGFGLDNNGAYPTGPVVFDSQGNLYGVAEGGGSNRLGVVFKLTPGANGQWTESLVHAFSGPDGATPLAGLTEDSSGHLYGTTSIGGRDNLGVVFALGNGSGEVVLHSFTNGNDGKNPQSTLITDAGGNLYGTSLGGMSGGGVVFKLTPNRGSQGWTITSLHSFSSGNGNAYNPTGLAFGADGNLYGTASGGRYLYGAIFKLTPNGDGTWSESTIYDFQGPPGDAGGPLGPVTLDHAGTLYGVAGGGATNWGTVYDLTPSGGGQWTETILYNFSGGLDGANPSSGPLLGSDGNLYGPTTAGGLYQDWGVIYQITLNP